MLLSSRDEEERLTVLDGRSVGYSYRNEAATAHAVNGSADAKRLDIAELPIAVESLAFDRRGTADVKDADEVCLDGVDSRNRRIGCCSVGGSTRSAGAVWLCDDFDIDVPARNAYAQEIAEGKESRELAHVRARRERSLFGHRRNAFALDSHDPRELPSRQRIAQRFEAVVDLSQWDQHKSALVHVPVRKSQVRFVDLEIVV